jgi:hypothetical protein
MTISTGKVVFILRWNVKGPDGENVDKLTAQFTQGSVLNNSIQFAFINTLSQQTHDKLQKQHDTRAQITKYNKQDTYETK